MRVTCGRCAEQFTVRDGTSQTDIACPSCGSGRFYRALEELPVDEPVVSPSEPAASPLAPKSNGQLEQPADEQLDDKVGERWTAEQPGPADAAPVQADAADFERASSVEYGADRVNRRWMPWAVGIALVVVIAAAAVFVVDQMGSSDRTANRDDPIRDQPIRDDPAGAHLGESEQGIAAETPSDRVEPSVAGTLDAAKAAVVKIETPVGIGNLMQYGTGFLIDRRGWVATNAHVLSRMTKDSRVKMADGVMLEVEGIVARLPASDLAIVKLKDPPEELTVLAIDFVTDVRLGSEVFAFGHPYDTEFSLSKGIVSRVMTTVELPDGARRQIVSKIQAPSDMVWIQHDAKISPGNSGGPLMDHAARVLGVNTFVHLKAEFGYASHVEKLRELASAASDSLEPLPDAQRAVQMAVSSRRMDELSQAITAFGWVPTKTEQYDQVSELARQMTLAKHALVSGRGTRSLKSDVVQRVAKLADQKFVALRKVPWSTDHVKQLNSFGGDFVNQPGDGVVFFGSVVESLPEQKALLIQVDGTRDLLMANVGTDRPPKAKGSHWLIVGFVLPQRANLKSRTTSSRKNVPIILTHYMLSVRY